MKDGTDSVSQAGKEVLVVRRIRHIILALTVATATAMAVAGPVFAGVGTSPS
jgi:hypothetical protein